MAAERNLEKLLRQIDPILHDEPYVFCGSEVASALAIFREPEGVTSIVERRRADDLRLPYHYVAAWITLGVHSDLDAVGFLAAVTAPLAAAGISCNVVSAIFHDHLFVPWERRHEAMAVLTGVTGGTAPFPR